MKRVLILSRSDDGHIPLLTAELERIGAPWSIFDPGAFPSSAHLTSRMGCETNARITLPDGQILNLDEIGSV